VNKSLVRQCIQWKNKVFQTVEQDFRCSLNGTLYEANFAPGFLFKFGAKRNLKRRWLGPNKLFHPLQRANTTVLNLFQSVRGCGARFPLHAFFSVKTAQAFLPRVNE